MDNPPPIYASQPNKDEQHLRLLCIFHFVFGGLALFGGIVFLVIHFFILRVVFAQAGTWPTRDGSAPPPGFYSGIIFFYVLAGLIILTACILNILSGFFLRQKKYRVFSIVVAVLDCFQVPFGTVLGVFTLVVLLRDSVRRSYLS